MKKSLIQKRLEESLKEIKSDKDKGASISFLSRKYFVSRPTMTKFLKENNIKG